MFLFHKFLGMLFEYPLLALINTLCFFTTLSGFGMMGVDYFAAS